MVRKLSDLPTKRAFYISLNKFIGETYDNLIIQIPREGEHRYVTRRNHPLVRPDTGNIVPPNSGRLFRSIVKPGRIKMNTLSSGLNIPAIKTGKISFIVNNESLYDSTNRENYWTKVANKKQTLWNNINYHYHFWENPADNLYGTLQTYASRYAKYAPSKISLYDPQEERVFYKAALGEAEEEEDND